MAFENDTNTGRVLKLVEALALIEKSAKSNRADNAAIVAMVRPLSEALAELTGTSAATSSAAPMLPGVTIRAGTTRVPRWASVREMAETANLSDLTVAMAVYLNRIDEALS